MYLFLRLSRLITHFSFGVAVSKLIEAKITVRGHWDYLKEKMNEAFLLEIISRNKMFKKICRGKISEKNSRKGL